MKSKRKLAAKILNISPKKVVFSPDALEDIKKAITRSDVRGLIAVKKITKAKTNESSRSRARKRAMQKRKGRQSGQGRRKGSKHSVISRKEKWIIKVRAQRKLLKELRTFGRISSAAYVQLYRKVKGGFFRNRRHIRLYIKEHGLLNEKNEKSA
jgi:large subunit ribosomal protein L19e